MLGGAAFFLSPPPLGAMLTIVDRGVGLYDVSSLHPFCIAVGL